MGEFSQARHWELPQRWALRLYKTIAEEKSPAHAIRCAKPVAGFGRMLSKLGFTP